MKIEPFNPGITNPQTSMPSFQKQGKIDIFNDENTIEATNPTASPERNFKRGREEVKKIQEVSSPVLGPSSHVVPPTPMPLPSRKTNYIVPPTPMLPRTKAREETSRRFPEETRMQASAKAALFGSNEKKRPRIDKTQDYPKNPVTNPFANRVEKPSSSVVPPSPMPLPSRKTNHVVPPTPMLARTKVREETSRRPIGFKFPEETQMQASAKAALFGSNESKRARIDETQYPKNLVTNRVESPSSPEISGPWNLANISSMPITPSTFSSSSSSSQASSFRKFDVTQKAANVAIRQVEDLAPFYEAFPDLLKDAVFLKNGVENAVFRKGPDVFKIPIRRGSEMLPSKFAEKFQKQWQSNYQELIPTFAKLESIRLTEIEFHTINSENAPALYYTKQNFYPTDVNIHSLTSKMIEELRGLILQETRADIRPSNFKIDQNGLLQLIDYNMPEDEDLDIGEMCRVWNVIHPQLGALLVEENDATFRQQLEKVFPEKCIENACNSL